MKLLIIINNLGVGGAERLVIDDIHELMRRGVDVELITLKPENPEKTLSRQLSDQALWTVFDFGSLLNARSWFRFVKLLKEKNTDVLITHLWYSNLIGRIAGRLSGMDKIILSFEHNVYDTLKTRKMFFLDRILQTFSTKIVAVSEAVKQSLLRHGIKEDDVYVIRNGIDISKYESLKNISRKKNDKFTFIFIGRLIKQKGLDILLKAFSKNENSELLLVGSGEEEQNLKELTKELKLEDRVKFLGVRQDIPELLINADCFVLPSRYEGLPMVLLEAVAAGKIIIVSDFASASEIITNGRNGVIVKRENTEMLGEAMNRVMKDQLFVKHLTESVSKDVETVSIRHHMDKILDIV